MHLINKFYTIKMNPTFQIESIFDIGGKGKFLALNPLNGKMDFQLTDYSTIDGIRIKNFFEIPRVLDDKGNQRLDIFVFQLENVLDAEKLTEGQNVSLKQNGLEDYWKECLQQYEKFEGWDVKPIKYIVRHICNSEYTSRLYPGISIMRLLISKPDDGKLNFSNTLTIDYNHDKLKQLLRFIYREDGEQKYSNECQASEGIDTFEEFMRWRKW